MCEPGMPAHVHTCESDREVYIQLNHKDVLMRSQFLTLAAALSFLTASPLQSSAAFTVIVVMTSFFERKSSTDFFRTVSGTFPFLRSASARASATKTFMSRYISFVVIKRSCSSASSACFCCFLVVFGVEGLLFLAEGAAKFPRRQKAHSITDQRQEAHRTGACGKHQRPI